MPLLVNTQFSKHAKIAFVGQNSRIYWGVFLWSYVHNNSYNSLFFNILSPLFKVYTSIYFHFLGELLRWYGTVS